MLIHNFIDNAAAKHPNKVAVIHDDQRITYQQLNAQTDNLAAFLQQSGIKKGDRVAILLANNIEYITAYYATLKAGAVAAPLNPALKPDGLQYLTDDLEPAAIVTASPSERLLKAVNLDNSIFKQLIINHPKQKWAGSPFNVASFDAAISIPSQPLKADEPIESDLANIIYTSGSTGEPKGVMLTHANIVANTNSICQYLHLTEKDIQMVVLPFFYVMGKSLLNTHMAAGGTVVINNRFMYPADVVNQMIAERVTGFSGVPSTFAYLLNRSPLESCKHKLTALRYCSQAGGHMAKSLKFQLRRVLPNHTDIVIMYGATEAAARLTYLAPDDFNIKIDSIGKPIPGVSIRVLNENGNEMPDGEEGELVASGPNIMNGYWKDSEGTAKVLSEQGYHTGDIGYRDKDGFLYAIRRKDGLLKVGGHRVNPTEIEDFLMATDHLIESSVISIPDKLMGKKLIALVVLKNEEPDSKILMELCAKGLPNHKIPADIITVRTLPKNANGKIDKTKCHQIASKTQQTQ